jgi:predicted NUDIX family NTP pyrophosphohydrolase
MRRRSHILGRSGRARSYPVEEKTVARTSAGILLHRMGRAGLAEEQLEVLIVHPGGPFFARKDAGAWSIPKGEYLDEEPWDAATREFHEELGQPVPEGERLSLGEITQSGGKRVTAFAVAGDLDLALFRSNTFTLEWPRGSGTQREFPEVDRAQWHTIESARTKLIAAQGAFLDRLLELLA